MTPVQFIFIITGIITLGAAIMVVLTKNLVHAALWLVLAFFGIAVLFVLLNAGFLAMAQIVIYIGAIAIIMIFAIMLTRGVAKDTGSEINPNWGWAALVSAVLFGGIIWVFSNWRDFSVSEPEAINTTDALQQLGLELVSPSAYVIPFEIASVLLLAALIGAIIIAWDKNK